MRIFKFFAVLAICFYGEYTEVLACDDMLDDPIEIESKNLVRTGKYFEPQKFWQKPMDEKLRFFAKPIIDNALHNMVAKHYWLFNMPKYHCTFVPPKLKPYTPDENDIFQDVIWNKLQEYVEENNLKLSKDDFIKSLRTNIHPESRVYDAPLIHHFESYLWCKASFDQVMLANNLDK